MSTGVKINMNLKTLLRILFDIKKLCCFKYESRDKMPNRLINPGMYEVFVILIMSKYPLRIIKGIDLKSRSKEN
tara:strand:+ start:143 stop:364 length:222 start_codon:yes stop_codon:yes gene_type:complete